MPTPAQQGKGCARAGILPSEITRRERACGPGICSAAGTRSVDISEPAADATLDESDPLGSFAAEDCAAVAVSADSVVTVGPAVAEVPVIRTIQAPRIRTYRSRLRARLLAERNRLEAPPQSRWTRSPNWNFVQRLKTLRIGREVSRWTIGVSAFVSVFAAGVLVGALTSAPGSRSNAGVERGADAVGSARAAFQDGDANFAATLEDRGVDPVGSARATMPGAVGTALVAPARPPRSPGHRGTLIVTSQPVGASVYVNNRLAGRTPLVMKAVPAGSRAVRLTLDGYAAWSRGVSVVANQSTTITAKLEAVR